MHVLAEIIASDVSLLVTFNHAIDGVIQNNPKARVDPKALVQLDGYKRPLVSSLSGNLQRFGMERVNKMESLQEIIAEMADAAGTHEKTSPNGPLPPWQSTGNKAHQRLLGGETSASVCHAECMANKQPKPSVKTTEWRIGQPLDSPQVHSGPLREAANEPMRDQFGTKRQKHKKK